MSDIEQSSSRAREDDALVVIAICLSAGGLSPLRTLIRGLPHSFPPAIVIAQHVAGRTLLPEILANDTRAPVTLPDRDERLRQGTIYVCPAQQHVIVNPDATLALSPRERLNFFRPSGDWLFTTAAASFRDRAVAIVLSGMQHDGAAGTRAIREAGGTVIVQDPSTCERPEMPRAAIATGSVDFVLAPDQISQVLTQLMTQFDLHRCKRAWEAPFLEPAAVSVSM